MKARQKGVTFTNKVHWKTKSTVNASTKHKQQQQQQQLYSNHYTNYIPPII